MKKRFLLTLLGMVFLAGSFTWVHAVSTCLTPLSLQAPGGYPYEVSYTTGPNDGCYIYYVDKSGNVALSGNLTVTGNSTVSGSQTNSGAGTFSSTNTYSGPTVYTPTNVVNLSTTSTIAPTATVEIIVSSGGPITMSGSGTNNAPVISTANATAGQWLILESTSQAGVGGAITISSGTAAGLHLGSATRTLSMNSVLTLIFDGARNIWKEVSFTGE